MAKNSSYSKYRDMSPQQRSFLLCHWLEKIVPSYDLKEEESEDTKGKKRRRYLDLTITFFGSCCTYMVCAHLPTGLPGDLTLICIQRGESKILCGGGFRKNTYQKICEAIARQELYDARR